jgi:hypothetical protein
VHVITDEVDTPNDILSAVENIVEESKAEGIKAIVTKPIIVPIDIKFDITLRSGSTASSITLASQIKNSISDYIDNLPMGSSISITEMLRITQSNQYVGQAYINSLYIDGKAAIIGSQYQLDWDERAYINNVTTII